MGLSRADFTDDEIRLLETWDKVSQRSLTARQHLGWGLNHYWSTAQSIFRKLKLPPRSHQGKIPRQDKTREACGHACGMAVVLGIFIQPPLGKLGQKQGDKQKDGG